ncbi:MAG TPA: hypothetical protein PL143_00865 [Rhodocyclaceae bacterium]|nr:hypothetical protein [Rhodocyclaceae bacterium]
MKDQLHRTLEIDARTWQIADERAAAKILLAYRRFASEKDVSPTAAALLTLAWCHQTDGDVRDAFDRRPAK